MPPAGAAGSYSGGRKLTHYRKSVDRASPTRLVDAMEVDPDQIRQAVEGLHNCGARLREVVPVVERFRGQTVWEGIVHVFDVDGHPTASRCYAWSSPIEGSDKRRF